MDINQMMAMKRASQQAQSASRIGAISRGAIESPELTNPYQAYKDHPFLMGLSTLAMGVGEGMTGRPFLTNFNNNLYEQKQAQLKYKQFQEEQKLARDKMEMMARNRQDVGIYQTDPITGELQQVGSAPYGSKVYKGVLSPDQMKARAQATGEAKSIQTDIETSQKLSGAVKRLELLNKQFKKALPSGDKTPLEQRITGNASSWAAKMGLINNPELVALQKNIRPIAINMIRAFGEVGNLSESEQQGAIDVVNQAGNTEKERIAATKQFIEYAIAGARPESIESLTKRKDITGILNAFGVDVGQSIGESVSETPKGKDTTSEYDAYLKAIGGK